MVYVMGVRFRTLRTMRESAIWVLVLAAGYVAFSFFEELYDAARRTAADAGLIETGRPAELAAMPGRPANAAAAIPVAHELRGTITQKVEPSAKERKRQVVLNANAFGHFHVEAEIAGKPVEFMTDTGATYVAL